MPWSRFTMANQPINVSTTTLLATYNQFHVTSKTRVSSYDFAVTSIATNSKWNAIHTNWVGSRTNATGFEIWYQVNGGSFSCLGTNGMYTYTTLWNNGSTDLWSSLTANQSATITAAGGSTINFTIYVLSGGPAGITTTGMTDAIGHPDAYCTWTVTELGA